MSSYVYLVLHHNTGIEEEKGWEKGDEERGGNKRDETTGRMGGREERG